VIGVKQARQQIPAGAWLLVDGAQGKIEFVDL
jgi:phosphohistidine swiveling domain-containing protein